MQFIDTHCHLQFDKLSENIGQVLDGAKAAGVNKMICVGTSVGDSRECIGYAAKYGNVWASVGAHPHDGKDFDFSGDPRKVELMLNRPKVVAVGEIGLDFFKNYSPKPVQEKMLRVMIETGLPAGLPFIFHVREAFAEFWRIFDSYKGLRGVVHSFSAPPAELDNALSRGLYVALNGIMTFTKDERQLASAKQVPLERLLLETDAPFLAPAPDRGKTCEPRHIRTVAEFLAGLRGEPLEKIAEATTKNAEELFGLK